MPAREVYPNASVALAALEVRHPSARALSQAALAKLKRRLSEHFPVFRSVQVTQITASPQSSPDVRNLIIPKYFSRDSTMSVSIFEERFVIETTRYVRWESFRELARLAFSARQDVGEIDGIERIGLRYVDEIRVPEAIDSMTEWSEWVDSSLLGPSSISSDLKLKPVEWQGVSVFEQFPGNNIVVRYGPRTGYAVDVTGDLKRPIPPPGPYFLIDIDSFWAPDVIPEFNTDQMISICDEIHEPVNQIFESLITEKLRKEVLRNGPSGD
ncbi:TIGR04255 family protein [Amycolatopsis sp. NPDC005961]|uniref:TIGR04255 family protein n=1 Tax=Amycolatopsis sp. NPDC005961 TaxID=3156720 RepID=UPI0033D7035A